MTTNIDPNDPNTWPVVECEPTDVFLGVFMYDCTAHLTDEQKTWPLVECEAVDRLSEPTQPPEPKQPPPSRP